MSAPATFTPVGQGAAILLDARQILVAAIEHRGPTPALVEAIRAIDDLADVRLDYAMSVRRAACAVAIAVRERRPILALVGELLGAIRIAATQEAA